MFLMFTFRNVSDNKFYSSYYALHWFYILRSQNQYLLGLSQNNPYRNLLNQYSEFENLIVKDKTVLHKTVDRH